MQFKRKSILILITVGTVLLIQLGVQAQLSGNQVYGNTHSNNNYYHSNPSHAPQKRTISTTDSTLDINISVLMNKEADTYMATLGVSHEAATVLECNKAINARINSLKRDLEPLGIQEKDFYIDFVSQTKIYDHKVGENESEEYQTGFEIKKNIILKIDELAFVDELIELASKQEIFDIIKFEYVNTDLDDIYNNLYDTAVDLLKSRKKRYLDTCPLELKGTSRILSDDFYAVSPKNQYKRYQAYETSHISVHNNYRTNDHYVEKEARKHTTYYYDGIPTSGFDKIINPTMTKVGIQYVFNLRVVYDLVY